MPYEVEWQRPAAKELRKIDPQVRRRIISAVEDLRTDPRPAQSTQLKGAPANWLRVRIGDYRIVYEVNDDRLLILVLRVGHRSEVYRRLT